MKNLSDFLSDLFIVIICIAFAFSAYYFNATFVNHQTEFKIYKNECHNETIRLGENLASIETISCNYTETTEYSKLCITDDYFFHRCGNNSFGCRLLNAGNPYVYTYKQENYSVHRENWITLESTKEVCEEKEVEEIKEINDYSFGIDPNGTEPDWSGQIVFVLHKKDLTLDWLDKNCYCKRWKFCTDYNVNCEDKCIEYQCGDYGNYKVKVKQ